MEEGNKLIITVLGYDRIGIIFNISSILAEAKINILDINQTILQGFFTMAMVVDMSQSTLDIYTLREKLKAKGKELGLEITAQHEDIFRFMHRI
ncbi:MAG TPA: ACT domain-containing protein [Syntrophomonadaceae bacterium]|nr:ACT domain-containing protein [Syntrophomonadaceae bacterium]